MQLLVGNQLEYLQSRLNQPILVLLYSDLMLKFRTDFESNVCVLILEIILQ